MVMGFLIGALLISEPLHGAAHPSAALSDKAAVEAAVLDYVEAIYEVQPDRVRRSVASDLNKVGVTFGAGASTSIVGMTFDQLVELAGTYNARGRVPAGAKKEIEVLDMQSHIANAKLEASWGTDYLLLTKSDDGRWQIRQVLWQAKP